MKKNIRPSLLLLCLACLFSLVSCTEKEDGIKEITAAEAGISVSRWIPRSEMPENAALTRWYDASAAREENRNAVYYAYDVSDELWHVWIYIGAWRPNDTLTVTAREDGSTYTVFLSRTATGETEENAQGVLYLTVPAPSNKEPLFRLTANGNAEGLVVTRAKAAVPRS